MDSITFIKYKEKLSYQEYQPNILIRDFVSCFWSFINHSNETLDFTILPDGAFDLIVNFDNKKIKVISLTGIATEIADVSIEANQQLFGIRFKLLAADYVLKKTLAFNLNSIEQLSHNFWKINSVDFSDIEKTLSHFNEQILFELNNTKEIDQRKKNLFMLLEQTKGQLQVSHYAKKVFWNSRQINTYFNKRFGLSLKTYCNILKVHSSLSHIKERDFFSEHNYYDQSHFIKNIKRYTHSTPQSLQQNKNDRFLQLISNHDK